MNQPQLEHPVYQIGHFQFSPISGVIVIENSTVRLRAKEAAMLAALVQSFPETLTREVIENTLYKNTYATNATINQVVKRLRAEISDEKRNVIRIVPKYGYVLSVTPELVSKPAQLQGTTEPINGASNNHHTPPEKTQTASTAAISGALYTVLCLSTIAFGYLLADVGKESNYYFAPLEKEDELLEKSEWQDGDIQTIQDDSGYFTVYFRSGDKYLTCSNKKATTQCQSAD